MQGIIFEGIKLILSSHKKLPEISAKRKTKTVKILSLETSDCLLHCIQYVLTYSDYEPRSILTTISAVWRMLWTLGKLLVFSNGLFFVIGITGVTSFVAF